MGDPLGGGKFLYVIFVLGMMIIIGMLVTPVAIDMIDPVTTVGWRPITTAAKTILPYLFWVAVLYIALSWWKYGTK